MQYYYYRNTQMYAEVSPKYMEMNTKLTFAQCDHDLEFSCN